MSMFEKILIANRGEIAVRVIRTARRLGIRTVAVYSEADAGAMHVELADEAVCIGPAPAAESYLRGDVILDVARRTASAGDSSRLWLPVGECEVSRKPARDAGVVFIGPPIEAIRVMGSKADSKRVMSTAGVPLVPGYHGTRPGFRDAAFRGRAHRLSRAGQSLGGRRRQGHAHRALRLTNSPMRSLAPSASPRPRSVTTRCCWRSI